MARAHDAEETARADTLLAQVRSLQQKALGILERAEADGDPRTALLGVREVLRALELQGNSWASWATVRKSPWASPSTSVATPYNKTNRASLK